MNLKEPLTIKADVLIVGSGAAGLRAAIAAREQNCDVLVVSQSRIGLGNNTAIAGRGVAAPNSRVNPQDSPEVYFRDTIIGGRFMNNQTLVDIMARSASQEIHSLERFGVKFKKRDGEFLLDPVPGFSYPRTHMPEERTLGVSFTRPMTEYAVNSGVRFISGIFICKLLKRDGQVAGAIGLDNSGQTYYFSASSIVLATGGLGHIYLRNDNAKGTNGDGYALAYHFGTSLVDMEFIQYFPTSWGEYQGARLVIYEPFVLVGAEFRNALNEDVLIRHGIKDSMLMTRSAVSRAMMLEIIEGRDVDGSVIMDLTAVPERVYSEIMKTLPSHITPRGRGKQLVSPTVHFTCGGIKISGSCETSVRGLFGAGEVCGGMQGANRVAGNAFAECYVMGRIAGNNASAHALQTAEPGLSKAELDDELCHIENSIPVSGKESVGSLHQELKRTMWYNAGIIRTDSSLRQALQDVGRLKEQMPRANVSNPADLIYFLSMDNMLTVSEMVCKSALMRTESRGNHYRSDFPDEDNSNWLTNIVVSKRGQETEHTVVAVNLTKLTP